MFDFRIVYSDFAGLNFSFTQVIECLVKHNFYAIRSYI